MQAARRAGDRVAITTRKADELHDRAGDYFVVLTADVTGPDQVAAAVRETEARFGRIDVLVNNAGRGWVGTVEGMPADEVRSLFELNFFTVLTVLRAVLPGMRERRSGTVVNVSSVAGLAGVPGFGYYAAAKHAIEGLTDTLRNEVTPFGLTVTAVEPGAFRTNAHAGFTGGPPAEGLTDYDPLLAAVQQTMADQNGNQPGDPQRAAEAVVLSGNPPHQLVLGSAGFDRATTHLQESLDGIRAHEDVSRSVDFPVIDRFFEAYNAQSPDRLLAALAPDAAVTDDGTTFRGADELRQWATKDGAVQLTPVSGDTEVTVQAAGDFPGSPQPFVFRFDLSAPHPTHLTITYAGQRPPARGSWPWPWRPRSARHSCPRPRSPTSGCGPSPSASRQPCRRAGIAATTTRPIPSRAARGSSRSRPSPSPTAATTSACTCRSSPPRAPPA